MDTVAEPGAAPAAGAAAVAEPAFRYYGQFDPPVDRFLHERYFAGREAPGVVIECGAFDGVTESSCKFFEETLGWTAVNVEPHPPSFRRLVESRPNSRNLNVALSAGPGRATFTGIVHPHYGELCTNGSLSHTTAHREWLDAIGCTYREYEVETVTYRDLVATLALPSVELLVLDVEGHELDVLRGVAGTPRKLLPKVLCIEHGHLGEEAMRASVEPLGYVFDATSFVNSYYLRTDVASAFAVAREGGPAAAWSLVDAREALERERVARAAAEAERDALLASRSWRITEPLRRLRRALRGRD